MDLQKNNNIREKSNIPFYIFISIMAISLITGLVFVLWGISSLDMVTPSYEHLFNGADKFLTGVLIMLPGILMLIAIGYNDRD